jgi:hypothetical protein
MMMLHDMDCSDVVEIDGIEKRSKILIIYHNKVRH